MDATSANFSMEDFMAAHSMESFCEQSWTVADYVVNKRLQEPKMFKVCIQITMDREIY